MPYNFCNLFLHRLPWSLRIFLTDMAYRTFYPFHLDTFPFRKLVRFHFHSRIALWRTACNRPLTRVPTSWRSDRQDTRYTYQRHQFLVQHYKYSRGISDNPPQSLLQLDHRTSLVDKADKACQSLIFGNILSDMRQKCIPMLLGRWTFRGDMVYSKQVLPESRSPLDIHHRTRSDQCCC